MYLRFTVTSAGQISPQLIA